MSNNTIPVPVVPFGADAAVGSSESIFDRFTASPSGAGEELRVRILSGYVAYALHYVPDVNGKVKPVFCHIVLPPSAPPEQTQQVADQIAACRNRIIPGTEQCIHTSWQESNKFLCLIWNYDTQRLECYRGGVQVFGLSRYKSPVKGFNDYLNQDMVDQSTGFWKHDVIIKTWPAARQDMRYTYSVDLGPANPLSQDILQAIGQDWETVSQLMDPRQDDDEIWRMLGYGNAAQQAPANAAGPVSPPPSPTGLLFTPNVAASQQQPQQQQPKQVQEPSQSATQATVQFPFPRRS